MKILSEILCIETFIRCKTKMLSALNADLVTDSSVQSKIEALQAEINADIDMLVDRKREALKAIDNAGLTPTETEVLYYRYLCMMKWPDIMEKMHYSEPSIHRIHKDALRKLNT